MFIFYKELSLEEGFEFLAKEKSNWVVSGKDVSAPSGKSLYEALRSQKKALSCWNCGLSATSFVAGKGKNDIISKPVLDLYAKLNGEYILMTQDHIIPKSLGGKNHLENLRVGCRPCNGDRGNSMNAADVKFMRENQHLIDYQRLARQEKKLK